MSHTIYTREQLSDMTESQLDLIYTELVGYPVIAESEGLETKASAIEMILEHYEEIAKAEQPAPVQVSHTPGPWKCEGWMNSIVNDSNGNTIATMPGASYGREVMQANARLISLAPEMLEVLQLSERLIMTLAAANIFGDEFGGTGYKSVIQLLDPEYKIEEKLAAIQSLLSRAK